MESTIPPAQYEALARCLHEYRVSAEQERLMKSDAGFQAWYAMQTNKAQP